MTYLPYHKLPYYLKIGLIYSLWINLKGRHTDVQTETRDFNKRPEALGYTCPELNSIDPGTCTVVQRVVFYHDVCAGLPCVLQVGVSRDHITGPGATTGDSCLITVTVPIPLTDLKSLFTLFYCFILIYAYKHRVCTASDNALTLK